ncbi:MAG: transglutaminase-like domain-containing protein [Propionibacteriaceae bacterium]
MVRTVAARIELVLNRRTKMVFGVAVADDLPTSAETLTLTVDGAPAQTEVVPDDHGGRLHQVVADGGRVVLDYRAEILGQAAQPPVSRIDLLRYIRPSRYCESDTLGPTAYREFGSLSGLQLIDAVADWVSAELIYVWGASRPTDGAVATLLARQGVCRDYAHLCIALLRAQNVPARLAAVYAPGLSPMEFHAVAEAYVDGAWYVVDATKLAPRQSLVRIATGRDAADTAFLTTHWAGAQMPFLQVTATVGRPTDPLPVDDRRTPVSLR